MTFWQFYILRGSFKGQGGVILDNYVKLGGHNKTRRLIITTANSGLKFTLISFVENILDFTDHNNTNH